MFAIAVSAGWFVSAQSQDKPAVISQTSFSVTDIARPVLKVFTDKDGIPSNSVISVKDESQSAFEEEEMSLEEFQTIEQLSIQSKKIKVGIVEDRNEIREGLATLLRNSDDYECTGAYRSMEEALASIPSNMPDILLCDIGLPGMNGIEGMKILKVKYPNLLTIMLTVYDDDERIVEAICAGASGYLLKNTATARLMTSLKDVVAGGAPMSPEVARRVMELFRKSPPPKQVDYNLTPHELRLLKMLVDGHNYKTSAATLNLSVNTISFHMRNVYEKLQVHSKSEAVAKALKDRLVS